MWTALLFHVMTPRESTAVAWSSQRGLRTRASSPALPFCSATGFTVGSKRRLSLPLFGSATTFDLAQLMLDDDPDDGILSSLSRSIKSALGDGSGSSNGSGSSSGSDDDAAALTSAAAYGSPASPREMTNRIKGFFARARRSPEEMMAFRRYLEANKEWMDAVNAVLLVEGCVRTDMRVRDALDWGRVFEAMGRSSSMPLTSAMVYRGLSCVRRISVDGDTVVQRYLRLLWERTEGANVVMEASDICPAIYSLQVTLTQPPPSPSPALL